MAGLAMGVGTGALAAVGLPYTPDAFTRHGLQQLADHGRLELPLSHWPLPWAAVDDALAASAPLTDDDRALRDQLRRRLADWRQAQGGTRWRRPVEALVGFDGDGTPGHHLQWRSPALDAEPLAARLALRLEQTSLRQGGPLDEGWGPDARAQVRLDGSALVLGGEDWNLQAFSHRFWWGPGWQSSLLLGHNSPAWTGLGVQRATVAPSPDAPLSWLGPWSAEVFVAAAEDPEVVVAQPTGFLFSGMRLSARPWTGLELGVSRTLQTAGRGRPGGMGNLLKAWLGQETNRDADDDFIDGSAQLAGYDLRLAVPGAAGDAALYGQWVGEDGAGQLPLPAKFMSLLGLELQPAGRSDRFFAEWVSVNSHTLPWSHQTSRPGYINHVYLQGYTQGGRWAGAAIGAGGELGTLGWLDAGHDRQLSLHWGRVKTSYGAYDPRRGAPHGALWGVQWRQGFRVGSMVLSPEAAYTCLSRGPDAGASRRRALQLGLDLRWPASAP